jgi:competence protein ComFB
MDDINIHNVSEDFVQSVIEKYSAEIESSDQKALLCTCPQCRLDASCYVLNRIKPRYIVSNRGAARIQIKSSEQEQDYIDISVLVAEAFRQVNHNLRPYFSHFGGGDSPRVSENNAVFIIPAIGGRLFNGLNFEPLENADIELRYQGSAVPMRDLNWQNPYRLTRDTKGNFTFWPSPFSSGSVGEKKALEFMLLVTAPGFGDVNHFFEIPLISEIPSAVSFSLSRVFQLHDVYIFPEGMPDEAT